MAGRPAPVHRVTTRSSKGRERIIERRGHSSDLAKDAYIFLIQTSWTRLILSFALVHVLINCVFALLYLADPGGLSGARPGAFSDAFFFSVETFSTIGYGHIAPRSLYCNVVTVVESFTGIVTVALVTGLVFAKFSRPTSRVLFSRSAVVHPRNGVPCLVFRLANERGNDIVEANISVNVLLSERTQEGEFLRRFHDLELERSRSPVFVMSWTVIHRLDENSPLRGRSREELAEEDARLIISLTGFDATQSATVHARHDYFCEDIVWDAKLVDVTERTPDGIRIDYARFHDTEPLPTPAEPT